MADNNPEPKQSEPAKRQRTPAPSIRQAAEQQHARSLKPSRKQVAGQRVAKPLRSIGRQLAKMGRFKPLRILGLILWPPYFRNSFHELRKVTWPDRRTTLRLSFAVLMFSLAFGLTVAGLDYGLDKIFRKVILQQ